MDNLCVCVCCCCWQNGQRTLEFDYKKLFRLLTFVRNAEICNMLCHICVCRWISVKYTTDHDLEHIHKDRPLVALADIQCFIHHKFKYTIHLVQTKICSTRITFFVSMCDIVSLNLLNCTLAEIRYNSNTYAVLLLSIISIIDIYCL